MATRVWKLKERARQYGLKNLAIRAGRKVMRKIGFYHYVFLYCIYDLKKPVREVLLPEGYHLREAEMLDFTNHTFIPVSQEKLSLFRKRFSNGNYTAFGIFWGLQLVYYAWICTTGIEPLMPSMDIAALQLEMSEGYMLDSYCDSRHRGKGLHACMIAFQLNTLSALGMQRAVMIVEKDNRAARKSMARMGFEVLKGLSFDKSIGKVRTKAFLFKKQL